MDQDILEKAGELKRQRKAFALVTKLETGETVIRHPGGTGDQIASALSARFRSGKAGTEIFDGAEYFLNPHIPSPRLVVIGAVHITQALVPLAKVADLDLTVIDPRTSFASPERFEGVRLHAEWPQEIPDVMALDPYTALAAITHDPKIDDVPIAEALKAGCFYVGALGSRKTHGKRLERLKEAGLTEEQTGRIKAPIGLSIGAASPGEIAVSIIAEVIETLRKPSE